MRIPGEILAVENGYVYYRDDEYKKIKLANE